MVEELFAQLIHEEKGKPVFFKNKDVFSTRYQPEKIFHRDEEFKKVIKALGPIMRGEQSSHLFIYGPTGTGKTLVVDKVLEMMTKEVGESMEYYFYNCMLGSSVITEFQLLQNMLDDLGDKKTSGFSTQKLTEKFFDILLEKTDKHIILVFDEIDALLKDSSNSGFLYKLLRAEDFFENKSKSSSLGNKKKFTSKITIIGISNTANILTLLDKKTKSSLEGRVVTPIFNPYNPVQLIDILENRAKQGLVDDKLDDEVIPKIAALTGRDTGDARQAIGFLRAAAEVASERELDRISNDIIDEAVERASLNRLVEVVLSQPKHRQLVLYSILRKVEQTKIGVTGTKTVVDFVPSKDVFTYYNKICNQLKLTPISERQARDHVDVWEKLDVIATKILNRGRHGRTNLMDFKYGNEVRLELIKDLEEHNNMERSKGGESIYSRI